jgi:Cytochrome C oxidase subunit II, transmembrane domain
MPQCGRLRTISVCGLEPTDPPPQKIADEMKGPTANLAPVAATHVAALEVAWTVVPVIILVVIAIPSFRLLTYRLVVPRAGMTMTVTASNAIGLIPILKTKVAASNAIPR